jgi:hypothetical protein
MAKNLAKDVLVHIRLAHFTSILCRFFFILPSLEGRG